mgnify:CR=1 FL=1
MTINKHTKENILITSERDVSIINVKPTKCFKKLQKRPNKGVPVHLKQRTLVSSKNSSKETTCSRKTSRKKQKANTDTSSIDIRKFILYVIVP